MAILVESTMPFKVRASCGHIVIRRMREATAGVPYTPETILDAPNGSECDTCEAVLNKIIDQYGCSRDVARIRAGIGRTTDGHSARLQDAPRAS